MMDLSGQIIGSYRLEALIGAGGMGQVYRARHTLMDRLVAIKILHSNFAADPTFRTRFLQEAKSAEALQHPNIVRIINFDEESGRYYLVMELIEDGSVRSLLQQAGSDQPLPLRTGIDLVRQAAEGLAFAHKRGMVHRDVKPDNFLVVRATDDPKRYSDYRVKITDFGLVKVAQGADLTVPGIPMGTPAYISPEQARGHELGPHSDIYSLGVVLYEVTTGLVPFKTRDIADAVYQVINTPLVPPTQIRPELPEELERITLKCLAKDPNERYSNADDLAADLLRLLTSLEPAAVINQNDDHGTEIAPVIPIVLIPNPLTVIAGTPASLTVMLANPRNVDDRVQLSIEGVPPDWFTLPGAVDLPARSQTPVSVEVLVRDLHGRQPGEHTVTIHARSLLYPDLSVSATGQWMVSAHQDTRIELQPASAAGKLSASYLVRITNNGAVTEQLQLTGSEHTSVRYRFDRDSVSVAPGSTLSVPLKVGGGLRLYGRPSGKPVRVEAQPPDGPRQFATGEFVHQPLMTSWRPLALVIVALLGVMGAGAAFAIGWDDNGNDDDDGRGSITATAPEATATLTPEATSTQASATEMAEGGGGPLPEESPGATESPAPSPEPIPTIYVFVADPSNNRVQKFDADGAFLAAWDGSNSPQGAFDTPDGVAVDSEGNVYVTDSGGYIRKFTHDGNYLATFGGPGSGNGEFDDPTGLSIDAGGNIFVADWGNSRIQKLDAAGNYLTHWGPVAADDNLNMPNDVQIDEAGNFYVVDYGNDRIIKYDSGQNFMRFIPDAWPEGVPGFSRPTGLDIDAEGNIYVADTGSSRILKFDSNGAFVTAWGGLGAGDAQLNKPNKVAVGVDGRIYVTDSVNHRVQVFSADGQPVARWGSGGTNPGEFGNNSESPWGIAVAILYEDDSTAQTPADDDAAAFSATDDPVQASSSRRHTLPP